jgi:hypothetical protein
MAGDNYTFKMPTEELKTQLEGANAELRRVRSLLAQALETRCPDPECANCLKWRAWQRNHGDVDWAECPICRAAEGQPCRRSWQGGGGSYPFVLKRPHPGRPGKVRAADPPADAP